MTEPVMPTTGTVTPFPGVKQDATTESPTTAAETPQEAAQRNLLIEGIHPQVAAPPPSSRLMERLKPVKEHMLVAFGPRTNMALRLHHLTAAVSDLIGALCALGDEVDGLEDVTRKTFVLAHGKYLRSAMDRDRQLRSQLDAKFDTYAVAIQRLTERFNNLERDFTRLQNHSIALQYYMCERGMFKDIEHIDEDVFLDSYDSYQKDLTRIYARRFGTERFAGGFDNVRFIGQPLTCLYNLEEPHADPTSTSEHSASGAL